MLTNDEAVSMGNDLLAMREEEEDRLELIHAYLKDEQKSSWLPSSAPQEVAELAKASRVNVLPFVVAAATESLYVDGIRLPAEPVAEGEERPRDISDDVWYRWQANGMDSRQIGLHRSALSYGASYNVVMPGDPLAVIRPTSPRKMFAVYGEDDVWPLFAIQKLDTKAKGKLYRLLDEDAAYYLSDSGDGLEYVETRQHGIGVCPVVRFRETMDLDANVTGVVEPLFRLQDQVNLTTFALLVAQHYGAHRQRYIIGWLAESEEDRLKASASRLWTVDKNPEDVKVGEFEQTELSGYIESRESTLRHIATISQTPVHELLGSLANLSAEALVAARDSHNRKLEEHRTVLGESHEQTLRLAAAIDEVGDVPYGAWVRWRDMGGRSLSQAADALGKMADQLGIPQRALWSRVADALGAPQEEVATWIAEADREGSEAAALADALDRAITNGG